MCGERSRSWQRKLWLRPFPPSRPSHRSRAQGPGSHRSLPGPPSNSRALSASQPTALPLGGLGWLRALTPKQRLRFYRPAFLPGIRGTLTSSDPDLGGLSPQPRPFPPSREGPACACCPARCLPSSWPGRRARPPCPFPVGTAGDPRLSHERGKRQQS